jgi:hypothetical protein
MVRRFARASLLFGGGLLVPMDAAAESIAASDCNLGFTNTYNKGDAVCVTGEFDQVPPSKIFAESYVYVIPVASANPFADASFGGPNYIIGSGGAGSFFDEFVWLPPLKAGQYEFVIDNYPFFKDQMAAFDPLDDNRTGVVFSVSNAPTVFSVDVNMIKGAAAQGLLAAAQLYLLAQTLSAIDTVSTVVDWWVTFGGLGGLAGGALGVYCTFAMKDCPTSYNSAVLTIGNKILVGMADSLTKKYDAIILDPPDPDFKAVVGLDFGELTALGYPFTPSAEHEYPRAQIALANAIALQSAAYRALVPSMEKVQGAKNAGDNLWQLLHAEKVKAYASLAMLAGDRLIAEADALQAYLTDKSSLDDGLSAADFNASLAAIQQGGFERGRAQPPALVRPHRGRDRRRPPSPIAARDAAARPARHHRRRDQLERARDSYLLEHPKPALDGPRRPGRECPRRERGQAAFRPGPALTLPARPRRRASARRSCSSPSAAHFDPDATLTYTWDLDLDGAYDDGAMGATGRYTPRRHPAP